MSTMYKTVTGDTFETISRKAYGTEIEASRIRAANPGAAEPLRAGVELVVPDLPTAPTDRPQSTQSSDPDEVAALIDGARFRFWDRIRVTRTLDSVDSVEIGAPFEADDPKFRETFRPFSFKPLEVTVGGAPLFRGTLVAVNPGLAPAQRTVTAGGYSTPGVLAECTAPASAYPLEFNGQDLKQIAEALVAPFGISVQFTAPAGGAFDRVACEPERTLLDFLASLAKQRGLVVSSTEKGGLLFQKSTPGGSPVARLVQGASPLLGVTPTFNPQSYYSHVTGVEPVVVGLEGAQYTVRNTALAGVLRPHTFGAPDTQDGDLQTAVEAKAARMFGGIVSYAARVSSWRDPAGQLWAPNTTVTLTAPGAMVYSEYEFLVRSVVLSRDASGATAELELVLPGAFDGTLPEALPWD